MCEVRLSHVREIWPHSLSGYWLLFQLGAVQDIVLVENSSYHGYGYRPYSSNACPSTLQLCTQLSVVDRFVPFADVLPGIAKLGN